MKLSKVESKSTLLDQQRTEIGHQVINKIRHTLKRFDERFTLDNPRFSERYIKSELHFLIHFSIGAVYEEFVVYLQREHSIGGLEKCVDRFHVGESGDLCSHKSEGVSTQVYAPKCGADDDHKAVFIDIVKLVEDPKRVVPTFVWFDSVDRVYGVLPHSLYFSNRFGCVFRGIIRNREVDMLRWTARRAPRPGHEKCIGQMIESTSEILKDIPGDSGDSFWNLPNTHQIIDQLSGLRIALSSDYIGIGCEKGFDFRLQIKDVLFGPLNFNFNPIG